MAKKTEANPKASTHKLGENGAKLEAIVRAAGAIAMEHFTGGTKQWAKADGQPVSDADMAVDHMLKQALLDAWPDFGWISEETETAPSNTSDGSTWIVDPIDGTRAFLQGGDDWGISVALVSEGEPVLAAFFAPARGEMYMAGDGAGAWLNETKLNAAPMSDLDDARMMGDQAGFRSKFWPHPWPENMAVLPANSIALRLCMIAGGQADCCVTLRPKNIWDMASADLILSEAGGSVKTAEGAPLTYNKDKPVLDHIVATRPGLEGALMDRVSPALKKQKDDG